MEYQNSGPSATLGEVVAYKSFHGELTDREKFGILEKSCQ